MRSEEESVRAGRGFGLGLWCVLASVSLPQHAQEPAGKSTQAVARSLDQLQDYGVCVAERAVTPIDAARTALDIWTGLELEKLAGFDGGFSVPLRVADGNGVDMRIPATVRLLDPKSVKTGVFEFVIEIDLPVPEVLDRAPDAEDARLSLYLALDQERVTKVATFFIVNHHHTSALQVKLKEDPSRTMNIGGLFDWERQKASWTPFFLSYLEDRDAWRSHKGAAEAVAHALDEGSTATLSRLGKELAREASRLCNQIETKKEDRP